jgi:hypothetical protein
MTTMSPPPLASHVYRGFIAIVGVALLTAVTRYTFGLALLAPIGMIAARYVARRQKSSLTLGTSWLGATGSVAVVFVAFILLVLAQMPNGTFAGTFANIQRGSDSASVASAKAPPPAWLERIAPGSTARARAKPVSRKVSHAFTVWSIVVGGVFAYTLFAVVIGTAGWVPSLLLSFAFTGRWIPSS